jgi:hypothetical protein
VTDAVLAKANELVKLSPSSGRWKNQPADELRVVEEAGGPALREFGYL